MGKTPCCNKATVLKGTWTPKEDAILKDFVERHGNDGNWISLPHKIGLNRCGKACRLRWMNYLRPDLKHGEFSVDEDKLILRLYNELGGKKWASIASHLPGRTDNAVKNRWNARLRQIYEDAKNKKMINLLSYDVPQPTSNYYYPLFGAANYQEINSGPPEYYHDTVAVAGQLRNFSSSSNNITINADFEENYYQNLLTQLEFGNNNGNFNGGASNFGNMGMNNMSFMQFSDHVNQVNPLINSNSNKNY